MKKYIPTIATGVQVIVALAVYQKLIKPNLPASIAPYAP